MLDLLPRRGPKAFNTFINALVFTRQEDIARLLDPEATATWMQQRAAHEENMKALSRNKHPPDNPAYSTGATYTPGRVAPNVPCPFPTMNPLPVPDTLPVDSDMTQIPKELGNSRLHVTVLSFYLQCDILQIFHSCWVIKLLK